MTTPHVDGDRLIVPFERFGLEEYDLFLRSKAIPEAHVVYDPDRATYRIEAPARFAGVLGVAGAGAPQPWLPLPEHLYDYNAFLVRRALEAKRYAVWADCGLGKTPILLEWARQVVARTGQRVLIFSLGQDLIDQTVEEAQKFYGAALPVRILETRADLIAWLQGAGDVAVAITHYAKLIEGVIPELRLLGGLAADESSILKSGGGVIKWNLIKSARGIEYKLSLTATPAPNDLMEYASQASFLEKLRSEGEILWTYFTRDKRGEWKVKPHAREAFYRFMASWSIYLRRPAAYGFKDNVQPVPEPEFLRHVIPPTPAQLAAAGEWTKRAPDELIGTAGLGVTQRTKLSQIAKGFLYRKGQKEIEQIDSMKPPRVADIIRGDLRREGLSCLVWTLFDEESRILAAELDWRHNLQAEVLDGSMDDDARAAALARFKSGESKILISKARLIGYGMNFQHVGSMVFHGWNDSFEEFYQALRRAYRYGQTRRLRVHIPYIEALEGAQLENVLAKQATFEADTAAQEQAYIEAMRSVAA